MSSPSINKALSQLGIASDHIQSTLVISRYDYAIVEEYNIQDSSTRAAEIIALVQHGGKLLGKMVDGDGDGDVKLMRVRSKENEMFVICGMYDVRVSKCLTRCAFYIYGSS